MTEMEKKAALTLMTEESDDVTLSTYLSIAAEKVVRKCYPFDTSKTEVPDRYAMTQIEIAAYLLNKRGAEGQVLHIEGGIHRHYGGADVPDEMLAGVIPFAGTF